MTTAWQHPVRAKLEAGESVLGITITVPNIESAAVAATLGFDFLWVEMEHSPITLETLRSMVLATRSLPAAIFARVPAVELWTAKRVLDQGVSGVIFPFVSTPEKARTAAASCRHPPLGKRGSGAGLVSFTWPESGGYYVLEEAIARVVSAGRKYGKFLGRPAGSPEQVQAFQQQGFRFFQSQTELGLLRLGAKALGLKPAEVGALY